MHFPNILARSGLAVTIGALLVLSQARSSVVVAIDSDFDGVSDAVEAACGGNAGNPNLRPERTDNHFSGEDEDGDQAIDESLPGAAANHDCDGDGFTGAVEAQIFAPASTRDQVACGTSGWPLDFVSGGVPNSTNKVTISDVASFVAPIRHLNTTPPDSGFSPRWDLLPGSGIFSEDINVSDITALISGSTGSPPMLGGPRAMNGPDCPWPVSAASFTLASVPNSTFTEAVALVPIPGTANEAVILTQHTEKVWRVSLSGAFTPTLYGDLSGLAGGDAYEEGLLALAFAPGFPTDNRVYAYYTQGSPQPSVLTRFTVNAGAINTNSAEPLLYVPQPYPNHNGGELAFGPDGYLYLSLGDGGSGGDPHETGQDNTDLLGSVLRLDVSAATGYAVPASNPYVGSSGRDEVWAYGFRNPWRFSFDDFTGDLWLGDVGQGSWEEIDVVTAGGNYGWDNMEGFACHEPFSGCNQLGLTLPRFAYGHSASACAVTGGFVYHGPSMPELAGWYIYGDFCNGRIWAFDGYGSGTNVMLVDSAYQISSFGQSVTGEIFVVTPYNGIFRLIHS